MSALGPIESFDAVAVGIRAVAFIAALQAAGLSLFVAAHRKAMGDFPPALAKLARLMSLVAVVIVLGHQFVEAARLAGNWSGVADAEVQRLNWQQSPGIAALACAAGLIIEYTGFALQGVLGRKLALVGALVVAMSFALTGHTTGASVPPLIRLLLVLHVTIVSYWLGSIVGLLRLTREVSAPSLNQVSRAFSALAIWLVPAIFPIGVGMAIGLLPNLAALRSVYGALLAAKLTGFLLLLTLAAFNRWRAVPALLREPSLAVPWYRRALLTEYFLLASVLSVTAVMTSLFSWH